MASEVFNAINQGTATLSQYTGPSVFAQVADQLAPAKGWLGGSASPFPTLVAIEAIALGAAIHSNQARDDSYLYARVGAYALPLFLRQLVQVFPTSLSFASGWYPIKDMGFDDLMKNPTYWIPSLVIYNVAMHFIAHRLCPKNKRGDYYKNFLYNMTIDVPMKQERIRDSVTDRYSFADYAPENDAPISVPASTTIAPSSLRLFKSALLTTVVATAIAHYTTPYLEDPFIPPALAYELLGIATVAALSKRRVMGGYLLTRALSKGIQELIHLAPPPGLKFSFVKPLLTIAKDKPHLADLSIEAVKENPPLWIGSVFAYNIALYTFGAWAVRHWPSWLPSIQDRKTVFLDIPPKKEFELCESTEVSDLPKSLVKQQYFFGSQRRIVRGGGPIDTMKTHLYAMSVGTAITIMLRHIWEEMAPLTP